MKNYLIVDGYNIIYAWPELEKIKNASLESARNRLIEILVNHAALSDERVFIVFDAYKVKEGSQHREPINNKITVFYTQEGETADTLIEKLVGQLTREKASVAVVTSDYNIQHIIFGQGASRLTPRELRARVKQAQAEIKEYFFLDEPDGNNLENRLVEDVRVILEKWRREKK
ncbi:MAG TPA: NYN domain-containing protein [Desulfotomaculum sp.]|nr:NYN domain-containing protein [Desulfotomaculum sp.]